MIDNKKDRFTFLCFAEHVDKLIETNVNEFQGFSVVTNRATSKLNIFLFLFKSKWYCLYRGGDGIAGSGSKPQAFMRLYYDADYSQMYMPGRVTMEVGSPLYMEVLVQTRDEDIVAVLEDCYATHTNNTNDPGKQFLIQDK